MTLGLRKAHKYIWLALVLIIPVVVFLSIKDLAVLPSAYFQSDESEVDGWSTTSPNGLIELWKSRFLRVPSQSRGYHAELNATQPSALYQRTCRNPNAEISWSVWHQGRSGVDVATVRIG
jgi:hypothetical protein